MIDRYSRPAMKWVWSDENKYQKWLEVELAVAEAWTEEGVAAVLSVGDPADTWFDPTQHGTDLQRTAAFAIGFDGGAADCTDQAFFDLFPAPAE